MRDLLLTAGPTALLALATAGCGADHARLVADERRIVVLERHVVALEAMLDDSSDPDTGDAQLAVRR